MFLYNRYGILRQINFTAKYTSLLIIITLLNVPDKSFADEYFNPALLEVRDGVSERTTDLSVFEVANGQPAGKYRVDISVNNEMVTAEARDVMFSKTADGKLEPCVTLEELTQWGINTAPFPELQDSNSECIKLDAIPDAFTDFQFNRQRLNLSIPHAALKARSQDEVPVELWDEGIPAVLLNYSMNSYQSQYNGADTYKSTYLNLRPGINIGPWRLRNYTTFEHSNQSGSKWDNVYSYLQRNIISLRSQLTLGDSSAPSDVFDSVPFRGVQLASDDDMLPSSVRNYAPVVRGIARSNALVTIRQNGYVVYETKVAPGAFEITDLASTGGAGDLDVTIKETDGSEQHLIIPYASLPVLQREGKFRYSVTGGQFRAYDPQTEKICLCREPVFMVSRSVLRCTVGCKTQAANTSLTLWAWARTSAHGALFQPMSSTRCQRRRIRAGNRVSRYGCAIAKISCKREQTSPSPVIAIQPPDFARWRRRSAPTEAIVTFHHMLLTAVVTGLSCR